MKSGEHLICLESMIAGQLTVLQDPGKRDDAATSLHPDSRTVRRNREEE